MSHPRMFDDADPLLARVREIALALPDAAEKVSHGRPAFYTRKVFAYYSGSLKLAGAWVQHPQSVMVLAEPGVRAALRARDDCYVPGYLGPAGWTGLLLTAATDWDEVAELIEDSYRITAPATLVARLDEPDGTTGGSF